MMLIFLDHDQADDDCRPVTLTDTEASELRSVLARAIGSSQAEGDDETAMALTLAYNVVRCCHDGTARRAS